LTPALDLARELIARRSVTPEDGGCQALVAARLGAALSYYTLFSLAPLLVIAVAVAGLPLD